jgi:hypothetical protein
MYEPDRQEFEDFVRKIEPGLRRAFFAALGVQHGRDATAEALAWAWENWPKVKDMTNPTGYLFRVGHKAKAERKECGRCSSGTTGMNRWSNPNLGESSLICQKLNEQRSFSSMRSDGH